jgi:PAS domain S-box-containing protein
MANSAMEKLVGYREVELTGCSVLSLAHPEYMEALVRDAMCPSQPGRRS